ncbi:MAG TPA: ferrochelatase [Casimicrobiaceae bacterium]|nr:ferrochelatase [Casimicrobiaceae bacterium]
MAYRPERPFAHDRVARVGVLLVNLGTPDAPTPAAVRRYLAQFLADPRVVEIPPIAWRPILHGVILRTRPARSARKYAAIWHKDGSPLLIHSQRQKVLLMGYLGQRLKKASLPADLCPVELGMRYGNPSIADAFERLRTAGCERILVLPLYPQYAASTSASALDAIGAHCATLRRVPGLRFVDSFHDDPGYIQALARNLNDDWVKHGRPDHVVLSFHGLPKRSLALGDPYHCHCQGTARLLAREAGLDSGQWTLSFQSRFGRAQWLQPYTLDVLRDLARKGAGRVDVYCPGFAADCLETLEEIGIEARRLFLAAGGKAMRVVPCLNEHPAWIAALAEIALRELGGWLGPYPEPAAREAMQLRARALGAAR